MEIEVKTDGVRVGVHGVVDVGLFFAFVFIDLLWYSIDDFLWVFFIITILIPRDIDFPLLTLR